MGDRDSWAGSRDVTWSPNDKQIATSTSDEGVRIWDAADGAMLKTFAKGPVIPPGPDATRPLIWDPGGQGAWLTWARTSPNSTPWAAGGQRLRITQTEMPSTSRRSPRTEIGCWVTTGTTGCSCATATARIVCSANICLSGPFGIRTPALPQAKPLRHPEIRRRSKPSTSHPWPVVGGQSELGSLGLHRPDGHWRGSTAVEEHIV